ncbi:GNAT family N-acetyltransferase [Pelagibacterium lacus]|uniref:N-acetyltransferase n=1 Tax=Pelagibacterium lacus TaxID=2282655 RepID=A0A369W6B2_9HYPH|nr:GNAT family N-acetyltransferase [Pelagibacterium lacus]RDE09405.1 N-acetyltransferase [Pelagibacterium lacus]
MIVRPATPADLPAILAIHNHAVRHLDAIWTETEETLDERRAWLQTRLAEGFPVLVAEAGGRVIGHASYGPYRPKPGYRKTVEHSVYLAPDAQRSGAGRALMQALIADARDKGFHLIIAVIEAKNIGSIRFHEHLGFTLAGTLPQAGFKQGRWLDQVHMYLLLDAAPPPPAGY